MKKILNWLTKWDKDKVMHFSLCLIISMMAACIVRICGGGKYAVLVAAWFAGFFAGVGKELYDEWEYKGADEGDWAADIIGTSVGTILSFLFVV